MDQRRDAGPALELREVSLQVGSAQILRQVSLRLRHAETGVLLGVSGAGKSSVLRLCMGLARPSHGEVSVLGTRLDLDNVVSVRRKLGYCVQDGGLFPHLSARDNVALVARELKWSAARIEERMDTLGELLRLPRTRLSHYPLQLSGGERQRVGLMRALMLDPGLLLLDEPFGALDPITRAELQLELREIFRRLGKAVLMVTHDLAEASHFADWVALMRDGTIVQQGSFAQLVGSPVDEFARKFVSSQRPPLGPEGHPTGSSG
ncbi:MAG: ATP-binding cassette domain-containing protein [Myxococcales bacterium]